MTDTVLTQFICTYARARYTLNTHRHKERERQKDREIHRNHSSLFSEILSYFKPAALWPVRQKVLLIVLVTEKQASGALGDDSAQEVVTDMPGITHTHTYTHTLLSKFLSCVHKLKSGFVQCVSSVCVNQALDCSLHSHKINTINPQLWGARARPPHQL